MKPLGDPRRMFRLRRGFCRSWWNDQWRDLMLAYLSFLGGGSGPIALDKDVDGELVVAGRPLKFLSQVSAFPWAPEGPDTEGEMPDDWTEAEDESRASEGSGAEQELVAPEDQSEPSERQEGG